MTLLEDRIEVVEDRTDRLETLFGQFMVQTGIALRRIDRSIERIDRSIERMEATMAEMKAEGARDRAESARYREESARYREESARYREESARYREESAREREESARYREESARERREMNKRWGELANKMGTLVEDIVAPSLRRMAQAEFGCGEERFFGVRIYSTRHDDPSLRREFDTLYVGSQGVLLNETKSSPRSEDARLFVEFLNSGEFALYFPEYGALPVVPVFSSLSIHPDLVTYLTRQGVYAVAMGEEAMQVLNLAEVDAV